MARGVLFICLFLSFVSGCQQTSPELFSRPGGESTIFDESREAFGHISPVASSENKLLFFSGRSLFEQNWVTAPSSTELRDGLGPLFNAAACSSCHLKDGRAAPDPNLGLLFRLSDSLGKPHTVFGNQFQTQIVSHMVDEENKKILISPEAKIEIHYQEIVGHFKDGSIYQLRKPSYHFEIFSNKENSSKFLFSPRIANAVFGLGLLEAVPEKEILSYEDPDDRDGNGISGKANYVYDLVHQEERIGRFGWKANQASIRQQIAAAFSGDMGITSSLFPEENCQSIENECEKFPNGGHPEISDEKLDRLELYIKLLAVPSRRNFLHEEVLQGEELFFKAGCQDCHRPQFVTDGVPHHPELSNQKIQPFTDLLLHDMGSELADNRVDGKADGREWRTAPLWGIGLTETVSGHSFFLHDGRARNLSEAILWHGGEAEKSKQAYISFSADEREALHLFLKSL